MTHRISRRALGAFVLSAPLVAPMTIAPGRARAATPDEIVIDWATYNPVSLVLKDQRLLENAFAADKIASAGCSPPAPTRRWSSSTPGHWISARPPAPPR